MDACKNNWRNSGIKLMNEWKNRKNEWMKEWLNKCRNKMNVQMNAWMSWPLLTSCRPLSGTRRLGLLLLLANHTRSPKGFISRNIVSGNFVFFFSNETFHYSVESNRIFPLLKSKKLFSRFKKFLCEKSVWNCAKIYENQTKFRN